MNFLQYDWSTHNDLPVKYPLIRRYEKNKQEQKERSKKRAEIFTPLHIVKEMVDNLIESDPDALNPDKTWLEITCGEGVFLTTPYDPYTGKFIPFWERVGVLDQKFQRLLKRDADNPQFWALALICVYSVYGYDISADNVMITRWNILQACSDLLDEWDKSRTRDWLSYTYHFTEFSRIAKKVVQANIFWMDGLTDCVPNTDIPAVIWDYEKHEFIEFRSIKEKS